MECEIKKSSSSEQEDWAFLLTLTAEEKKELIQQWKEGVRQ